MNAQKITTLVLLQFMTLGFAQNNTLYTEKETGPPPPSVLGHEPSDLTATNSGEIMDNASQSPEFPGGTDAFRKKVLSIFDSENVKGQGRISSECTFVIERDGSMSNIKVTGNNTSMNTEAARALNALAKRIKWEPAKHKGSPVRARQRLPLTLVIN